MRCPHLLVGALDMPHPGGVGRDGGGGAPLQRAWAFGNLVLRTVRVPAEYRYAAVRRRKFSPGNHWLGYPRT